MNLLYITYDSVKIMQTTKKFFPRKLSHVSSIHENLFIRINKLVREWCNSRKISVNKVTNSNHVFVITMALLINCTDYLMEKLC